MGVSRFAWLLAVCQHLLGGALSIPLPPEIPSSCTATSELVGLTVAAQGSQDGYSRALFPHWITQSG
jgi:hypothetical protein